MLFQASGDVCLFGWILYTDTQWHACPYRKKHGDGRVDRLVRWEIEGWENLKLSVAIETV